MKTRIKDQAAYKVSIFCDSKPNDNGYQRPFFTIDKSYKNKSGEYKDTKFLDLQELHVLKSLLDRAILWAAQLDEKPTNTVETDSVLDELPSTKQLEMDVETSFKDDDIPF